ncbi:MAG: hypothetical protein PHD03_01545 [Bacilli bacterium]|nr:hypothetical protein [Bacilli bacterium]MDD4407239.1 hypothetical protein [Bacilli bacterium]
MREAIGGTWIFGIVIIFIVLFSSYLAISVNYSKAFKVKNAIVSMIEKYEGHGQEVQNLIKDYNKSVGYGVSSNCSDRGEGYDNVNTTAGIRSRYCVKCIEADNSESRNRMHKSYYNVTVFFKLDLPIIGNIFVFPVTGETKPVYGFCQM